MWASATPSLCWNTWRPSAFRWCRRTCSTFTRARSATFRPPARPWSNGWRIRIRKRWRWKNARAMPPRSQNPLQVARWTCFSAMETKKKIRVIVVDDSALVRSLLAEIINRQSDMQCIGTANDPLIAREMIRELNPDVITLDIEMPRMDGIDFLGRLMRLRPMPVVMVSTLTERGAEITMKALELGAVDFVAKPRIGVASGLSELANQIGEKVRIAASAHVRRAPAVVPATAVKGVAGAVSAPIASIGRVSTEKLIC